MSQGPSPSARTSRLDPPLLICVTALTSLLLVLLIHSYVTSRPLTARDTWLPMLMGLLGSAIYLMYNMYSREAGFLRYAAAERTDGRWDWGRLFVRLFLGPIAGWISYTLLLGSLKEEQLFVWLPFLAGFSSDLLVGIISQVEKAIKTTLGIQAVEDRENQHNRNKASEADSGTKPLKEVA